MNSTQNLGFMSTLKKYRILVFMNQRLNINFDFTKFLEEKKLNQQAGNGNEFDFTEKLPV